MARLGASDTALRGEHSLEEALDVGRDRSRGSGGLAPTGGLPVAEAWACPGPPAWLLVSLDIKLPQIKN